ncbi:hypothetical protein pmac_cds_690 [Pandoravirus macleodensis]|uniref:Uncharacterized protein n=1 Tax=Pandoravirus macleodensis TaxID=2107707 RepID=A0A2U7UFV3_9VIRU|nr:hypothetical protein pmac_cds_690 [Pandoravirus macleodensis]AVK77378.1 hypothetical protein pmac_cds_690 [Pandoravirus macleodensis]
MDHATGHSVDATASNVWDAQHRAALDEAARTGIMPYAPEAISAREDAFDRALVRSVLAAVASWMSSPACEDHVSIKLSDPLGPLGDHMPIAPTLWIECDMRGSGFCASRLADGTGWYVYRIDPQWAVPMDRVGQCVFAGPQPMCAMCFQVDGGCMYCNPWPAATEPPAPTDPGSMDPQRWPIGVAWTWTHAEMEDRQVALLRSLCSICYCVALHRTVRGTDNARKVTLHTSRPVNDLGRRGIYISKASWAFCVAARLVGKASDQRNVPCASIASSKIDPDNDGTFVRDGCRPIRVRRPLTAHDCTVGLAEARTALDRLKYMERLCCSTDNSGRPLLCRKVGALKGWITAVDALLSGGVFYPATVAPYEAALLNALTHGLVGQ